MHIPVFRSNAARSAFGALFISLCAAPAVAAQAPTVHRRYRRRR